MLTIRFDAQQAKVYVNDVESYGVVGLSAVCHIWGAQLKPVNFIRAVDYFQREFDKQDKSMNFRMSYSADWLNGFFAGIQA